MAINGQYKDPVKILKNNKEDYEIKDYILDCALKTQYKWFSGKTLFGGGKSWENLPIGILYRNRYNFYLKRGITNEKELDAKAAKQAGKDLGNILLRVLIDSEYTFERRKGWVWEYRLEK